MKKLQQILFLRMVCVIVLAAIAPSFGFAQEGSTRQIEELMDYGNLAARRGAWNEAQFRWKQVLKMDPQYSPAHNNLAIHYERNGDYRQAQNEYQLALEGRGGDHSKIRENFNRFSEFYERILRTSRQGEAEETPKGKKKKP